MIDQQTAIKEAEYGYGVILNGGRIPEHNHQSETHFRQIEHSN